MLNNGIVQLDRMEAAMRYLMLLLLTIREIPNDEPPYSKLLSTQRSSFSTPRMTTTTTCSSGARHWSCIGGTSQLLIGSVLPNTKLINQKVGRYEQVLAVNLRKNVHEKIVQVTYCQPMEQIKIGIPHKDGQSQVSKRQVNGLHWNAPNVRLCGGIPFTPHIHDEIDQILGEHGWNRKESDNQRICDQNYCHGKEQGKGVISRSTPRARVEGASLLVPQTHRVQHENCDERLKRKRPGIAKASQGSPQLKSALDGSPLPDELPGIDHAKIARQCADNCASEPVLGDHWKRPEPLRCSGPVVHVLNVVVHDGGDQVMPKV